MTFNSIPYIARCTGFPERTLREFVKRGLLPPTNKGNSTEYDGLAMLATLEELNID